MGAKAYKLTVPQLKRMVDFFGLDRYVSLAVERAEERFWAGWFGAQQRNIIGTHGDSSVAITSPLFNFQLAVKG